MRQRPTIDYVGSILVLLVVVLVPTFLGLLSVAMPAQDAVPAQDATLTTADASAAALHTLGRNLQNSVLPPAHAVAPAPHWWNVSLDSAPDAASTDSGEMLLSVSTFASASEAPDVAMEPARLL